MNTVVWKPHSPETTNMARFMHFVARTHALKCADYQDLHAWSVNNPALFWTTLCDFFNIKFNTPPTRILNEFDTMRNARWFEGATFNFAEQLLRRDDAHPALICTNEGGDRSVFSFHELRLSVQYCAAGLKHAGVQCGDRVVGILPNTFYPIIAMLATASIGAIWASCSPDFGLDAVVERLGQIGPKVLFVCDGYQYQGKQFNTLLKMRGIKALIPSLTDIVVCPFLTEPPPLEEGYMDWETFLKQTVPLEFASLPFDHPLYILFSSGTTGAPKCIVHGAGGTYIQHLKELGLHTNLGMDDRLFFYTTCGWMMWNWMVTSLALGTTLVVYDGAPMTPTPHRLFQLIDEEGVTVFGTSAKFLSEVEHAHLDPIQSLKLLSLRCILSTGSPLLPQQYDWVELGIKHGVQLCSISGGTDIVSCFALGNPMWPVYRGELQCAGLGMDVVIFNESGLAVIGEPGELICKTPFPSMPLYFWNDPEQTRYRQAYFETYPGIWAHGDRAEMTPHHGFILYGRSDAVLNPGGVRIGTAELYRPLEKIEDILESVVIGQPWNGDVRIVLFVKLREGVRLTEALKQQIKNVIRTEASPKHVPAKVIQVPDIPRTLNGKVVELAVRDVVAGRTVNNLKSIANPEALAYFRHRVELTD